MKPFTTLRSIAVPLPLANVDTDQLIPARFMKRPRSEGYGAFLLHDMRQPADGRAAAEALDDARYAGAACLIARRNFGCGSSREAAVYALADFGFRCVVAPSFGDIFASNAVKNGLLLAQVSEPNAESLLNDTALLQGGETTIDLSRQTIAVGDREIGFAIDSGWKERLLNGWSDIDLTNGRRADIEAFRARDRIARPWARPVSRFE